MAEVLKANPSPQGTASAEIKETKLEPFGPLLLPTWEAVGVVSQREANASPSVKKSHRMQKLPGSVVAAPSISKGFLNLSTDIQRKLSRCQALRQSGDSTAPGTACTPKSLWSHKDPHAALRLSPGRGPCCPARHLHYLMEAHSILIYCSSVQGKQGKRYRHSYCAWVPFNNSCKPGVLYFHSSFFIQCAARSAPHPKTLPRIPGIFELNNPVPGHGHSLSLSHCPISWSSLHILLSARISFVCVFVYYIFLNQNKNIIKEVNSSFICLWTSKAQNST